MNKQPQKPRGGTTRREFFQLSAAAAIVALIGGDKEKNRGGSDEVRNRTADVLTKPESTAKLPEYDEWASKIELPTVEFDTQKKIWSQDEIIKHFIPENTDAEKLQSFYDIFDQALSVAVDTFNESSPNMQRQILLADFFKKLTTAYAEMTGTARNEKITIPRIILDKINRLLVPHGYHITKEKNEKYIARIYKIDSIKSIKMKAGDSEYELPAAYLGDRYELSFDRNGSNNKSQISESQASYFDSGNYMVIKERWAEEISRRYVENINTFLSGRGMKEKMINPDSVSDFGEGVAAHEATHAYLERVLKISGFEETDKGYKDTESSIKKRCPINMGLYTLAPEAYERRNNINLHEMITTGVQLMNSGEMVSKYVSEIFSEQGKNYIFARDMFVMELVNSPAIDEKLRRDLASGTQRGYLDIETVQGILINTPKEEFYRIGERMAKLGIYLTQE
ncbi:hypothetical protein JW758_04975 [Candidatus Peregrinibacteria bacterium]|nr:hypothetical protein [Candidatus Peregrinibacteria bacterium]